MMLLACAAGSTDVSELAWMSGCWSAVGGEPGSGEHWTAPAGGTLFGISRTVSGGKTVAWEFLRIAEEQHQLVLIASPSGQERARFVLKSLSANEATFENPEHDFPQRIIYRLDDDGNLIGRIEGIFEGNERNADFPMTRKDCD